jgi:hypothetical protein
MKSRALIHFRLIVAAVLGIVFVAPAMDAHHGQSVSLPWRSVPWVFKALFGLLWMGQSFFLWRQLSDNSRRVQ